MSIQHSSMCGMSLSVPDNVDDLHARSLNHENGRTSARRRRTLLKIVGLCNKFHLSRDDAMPLQMTLEAPPRGVPIKLWTERHPPVKPRAGGGCEPVASVR